MRSRRLRGWVRGAALFGTALGFASSTHARGPLGANGEKITTSDYAIDLFQGPVFAGSRVTGLGGAYVAIASDVDGMLQNPVAPAVRPFFSVTYFDYWLGFGLTFPSTFQNMDFFNSGAESRDGAKAPVEGFVFATPAAMLQFGAFGFGLNFEFQAYDLGNYTADGQDNKLVVAFNVAHAQMAYAFERGELVLGTGVRYLFMDVRTRVAGESRDIPLRSLGAGLELGALWRPPGEVFSFGAAYRTAIDTTPTLSDAAVFNDTGDVVFETDQAQFYLPTQAVLPWDLNIGVTAQIGVDPENEPWVSDRSLSQRQELRGRLRMLDREAYRDAELARAQTPEARAEINARYDAMDRNDQAEIDEAREAAYWEIQRRLARARFGHVVVAASALISGSVDNAVGLESFLSQEVNRSGDSAVVSLRLGAEMGLIPNLLRVRSGTYLEPTRFETSLPRPHYTGGFDLRLAIWNVFGLWPDDYVWRLSVGVDVARDYSTFGVTIAGWYPRHRGKVNMPGVPEASVE